MKHTISRGLSNGVFSKWKLTNTRPLLPSQFSTIKKSNLWMNWNCLPTSRSLLIYISNWLTMFSTTFWDSWKMVTPVIIQAKWPWSIVRKKFHLWVSGHKHELDKGQDLTFRCPEDYVFSNNVYHTPGLVNNTRLFCSHFPFWCRHRTLQSKFGFALLVYVEKLLTKKEQRKQEHVWVTRPVTCQLSISVVRKMLLSSFQKAGHSV